MSNLSSEIRLRLEKLVDDFVVAGAHAPEIMDLIGKELAALKVAYDEDPDPADDDTVIDEPANDWPSA